MHTIPLVKAGKIRVKSFTDFYPHKLENSWAEGNCIMYILVEPALYRRMDYINWIFENCKTFNADIRWIWLAQVDIIDTPFHNGRKLPAANVWYEVIENKNEYILNRVLGLRKNDLGETLPR